MKASRVACERYCRLLGQTSPAPDLASLRRLVRAQLMRAPFENISKLYGARCLGLRELPTLERYLDEMERFHFGGTCYPNNIHFSSLLRHLGFDVSLCGADMESGPDVHVVSLVRVAGREYLVDVGYGAPFYEPIPRDTSEDREVRFGDERYVLKPRDGRGRSQLDHWRDGTRIHGYRVNPADRDPAHFDRIIRESYDDSATFMNSLRLSRFTEGRSVSLRNGTLVERTPSRSRRTVLRNREAIVEAIERQFGIPAEIVRQATVGLDWAGWIAGNDP